MPAVPASGLVVIKAELGLRRFEGVLDGPAMPLDLDQRRDVGPGRTPGREERQFAISDAATDQKTARPQPSSVAVVLGSLKIAEFAVGPVVKPLALRPLARGEAPPGGSVEILRDLLGRAGQEGLVTPGVERMSGADPKHVALADHVRQVGGNSGV